MLTNTRRMAQAQLVYCWVRAGCSKSASPETRHGTRTKILACVFACALSWLLVRVVLRDSLSTTVGALLRGKQNDRFLRLASRGATALRGGLERPVRAMHLVDTLSAQASGQKSSFSSSCPLRKICQVPAMHPLNAYHPCVQDGCRARGPFSRSFTADNSPAPRHSS